MTYMEQFPTAESYVLHQITRNRGSQNCISKAGLIRLAEENHVPISNFWSKNEIAEFLMETIGVESLADACEQMGVSSYSFQQKFGISGIDVKLLANRGMLKTTGKGRFSVHGEPHYAPLYSVMQFYLLTPETVQEWLEDLRNVG